MATAWAWIRKTTSSATRSKPGCTSWKSAPQTGFCCYYKAVKHATAQSVADYKASLERVFSESARRQQPVPPGLYCDYAMLLIAERDFSAAREYLLREKSCWPESALLVDYLFQRYGLEP